MKNLVDLLISSRMEKELSITELAEIANMSHATISRVENQRSELTMLYVRKVFDALDQPFSRLIADGYFPRTATDPYELTFYSPTPLPVLEMREIAPFIMLPIETQHNVLHKFYAHYADSIQGKTHTSPASSTILPGITDYLYHLDTGLLLEITKSRGMLLLGDLGAYIFHARKDAGLSLRKLGEHTEISHSRIRALEQNFGDRTLFNDILAIDSALQCQGEFITLAWKAFGDYMMMYDLLDTQTLDGEILQAAMHLISISRLLQGIYPDNRDWKTFIIREINQAVNQEA